jgi:hypothetical protein
MNYKEIKDILDDINETLYYHENAPTSDKQVLALEELEKLVDELQDLIK